MTPPLTEQALRRHFAPLAELEPTAADVAALRARCISPPRRPARRLVPACAAGAIAVAAALALVPGRTHDARLAPDVLSVTAATAAARPVPSVATAPFRYTRIRRTLTYVARRDGREGREHLETTVETWVGSRWRGRERGSTGRRRLSGDPRVARMQLGRLGKADALTRPYVRPFAYGDGPLARLDPTTLPDGRDELARALQAGIRTDRWGPYPESRGRSIGMPEDLLRSYTAYQTITLLVYARLSAPQRAALVDVLSSAGPARDLGTTTDAAGRRGRAVSLSLPITDPRGGTHHERFRLVFDPHTAEILAWSHATPWSPRRSELVLETGWAGKIGERPSDHDR